MNYFITTNFYTGDSLFPAGDTSNLTLRLLGDPDKRAAVEIYDGFTWNSICATTWNLEAAGIVCRHFGYITARGALQIPVDDDEVHPKMLQVTCETGSVVYESLLQCNTETSAECLCSIYKAGVVCSNG